MSQYQPQRSCEPQRRIPLLSFARYVTMGVFFAAAMALLGASALPAAAEPLQITMSPTLYPAFDPGISDYVFTYQAGVPEQVSVKTPPNTKVCIDGQPFQTLAFTTTVNVTPGQSFSFVVQHSAHSSRTYHVRCLPSDFPAWTTERPGTPQAEYYVFAPGLTVSGLPQRHFIILADNYGVPLWWYRASGIPDDAKLLPDGNVAWINAGQFAVERRLDGSLVHTFSPVSSIGGTIDQHELQMLPNGDYLFIVNVLRGPSDLSPYGGSPTATILDDVIEEVALDGSLVWSWSAMDHIPVSETDAQWKTQYLAHTFPADPYHINSVEPTESGFVISCRHLDAVLLVDKASGSIVWKLGSSAVPQSLALIGDTYGNFGGQHDARILPDGTLTLHDNGTNRGRGPRAVRYQIDPTAGTATLLEQVTDPDVMSSPFIGSARKLSGGNWVMGWGGNSYVTEQAPDGTRVFRMTFLSSYLSYRANPVEPGVLSRAALRSGMDAQFPREVTTPAVH